MHLRRVEQIDLYDFAQAVGAAMWDGDIMIYTAPRREQYLDSYFRYCLHRVKVRWYRGELLFLAVTDEGDPDWSGSEDIMGYCAYSNNILGYQAPVRGGWLGNSFEREALNLHSKYARLFKLDRSCDLAAMDHVRNGIIRNMKPYLETLPDQLKQKVGDRHWELTMLGTCPKYRRKGVGKMMLQWGFERATQDHVPLVLVASVEGQRLYQSTGFQEFNRTNLELDIEIRGSRVIRVTEMVWEPKGFRDDDSKDYEQQSV